MFDLLKKKISGFVDKIKGVQEGKAAKEAGEREAPEPEAPVEGKAELEKEKAKPDSSKRKKEEKPKAGKERGKAEGKKPEAKKKEKEAGGKKAKPESAPAPKKEERAAPAKEKGKTVKGQGEKEAEKPVAREEEKPAPKEGEAKPAAQKTGKKEAPESGEEGGPAGKPAEAPEEAGEAGEEVPGIEERAEAVEAPPAKGEVKKAGERKAVVAPMKEEAIAPPEGAAKEEEAPSEKEEAKPEVPKKKGILESIFGMGKGKKEKAAEEREVAGSRPEAEEGREAMGEVPKAGELEEGAGTKEEFPESEERERAGGEGPLPGKETEREKSLQKKVKKGIFAAVTETITGESEIREEEVSGLLDELELGMLESDVALSVAEEIKVELGRRITGSKVKRGQTAAFVQQSLKEILLRMLEESPGFELGARVEGGQKPYKILVVGPNGAGKTTTIAKIVKLLQKKGNSVCIAASDTFRAAAVEQLVHHGNILGVSVIHGAYGSDPASIAFDALNHAKAHGIEVVLIDTAGRQDTNLNLINQLKKMDRVIKPDLKIYVGESIAGNAMVEQISTFNKDIGLDGVVLTKLDCDAKGGTVISVSRVAKLPILYVGVGQGYDDLEKFDAQRIVGEILS